MTNNLSAEDQYALRVELAQLERDNALAERWGAAVGARHERIRAIRSALYPGPNDEITELRDQNALLLAGLQEIEDAVVRIRNEPYSEMARTGSLGALLERVRNVKNGKAPLSTPRSDIEDAVIGVPRYDLDTM